MRNNFQIDPAFWECRDVIGTSIKVKNEKASPGYKRKKVFRLKHLPITGKKQNVGDFEYTCPKKYPKTG